MRNQNTHIQREGTRRRTAVGLLFLFAFSSAIFGCSSDETTAGGGGAPDVTAPTVVSVSPAEFATGVSVVTPVVVTFSEPIDPASATPSTISLVGMSGTVSAGGVTATFTPSANLDPDVDYTLQVTAGVRDLAGNSLAAPFTSNFHTANIPAADAGADMAGTRGQSVTLDGTGSAPVAGGSLVFEWTQLDGPDVGFLTGSQPTFTAPDSVVTLRFELVVTEEGSPSSPDEVTVVISDNASGTFFVSTSGDDGNSGAMEAPMASLQLAINAAAAAGGGAVHVVGGTYDGRILLASGVSLYGGYDSAIWQRDPLTNTTTIGGSPVPMLIASVSDLTVDGCTILASDATAAGGSSVGVHVHTSTGITLSRNIITAGQGRVGANGINGPSATIGGTGRKGDNCGSCSPARAGGAGGSTGTGHAGGGAGGSGVDALIDIGGGGKGGSGGRGGTGARVS